MLLARFELDRLRKEVNQIQKEIGQKFKVVCLETSRKDYSYHFLGERRCFKLGCKEGKCSETDRRI